MASCGDDTPPCHSEKRSKRNQDHAESSRPTRRTKASLPCDAASGRGARAAHAQAQALALPVSAAAREFIPGLGDVPVVDPTEEALDQAGRTIVDDVCTMTPPSSLSYFRVSRLVLF